MTHPDAVVLGGGIMGLACARDLASAGMRVVLLERQPQGAGASRAAAGILAPLFEPDAPAPLVAAGRAARDLWVEWAPELAAEAGRDVEHDRSGALWFALGEQDEAAIEHAAAACRRFGEPVEEIAAEELTRRTPGVAKAVRRVLHFPGDHRVDNVQACEALTAACRRRGVELRYAVRVQDVARIGPAAEQGDLSAAAGSVGNGLGATSRSGGDARTAVRIATDAGQIEAGLLVLAAGAWSGQVPGLPALPVRPVRGQMALLGGVAWPWKGISRQREVYLVRRGETGLLVGATVEEAGFDAWPTAAGIAELLHQARRGYPALGAARFEAAWAGLRPGTPDDLPIVGWLPGWPALVATGHFRSGILLAPWTAQQIARLATAGGVGRGSAGGGEDPLAAFSPARFAPDPSPRRTL
jgi:glycine oxidase